MAKPKSENTSKDVERQTDIDPKPSESNESEFSGLDDSDPPDSAEAITGIPDIPEAVLGKLPPEVRQQITLLLHQQRIGLPVNPIASKVTPQHIDKLIDASENESIRDYDDRQSAKKYYVFYVCVFVALFVFIIVYLIDRKPDLIKDLINYVVSFLGGFGLKSYLEKRRKD